jgi:hypothetical protein
LKNIFILILLILNFAFSAKITVCPSGCDFVSINEALNFASASDSIELKNGPKTYTLQSSLNFSSKSGVTVYSSSSPSDSIECGNNSITLGNFTTLKNLKIHFTNIISNNVGGFKIERCLLNGVTINFNRSARSYKSTLNNISNCVISQCKISGQLMIDNLSVDSCTFINAGIQLGDKNNLRYCRFFGGSEPIGFQGDSINVENNYCNGRGAGGEYITFDNNYKQNCNVITIRNNVIDSTFHVPIMFDGCSYCDLSYNIIIYSGGFTYALYNHQRDSSDFSNYTRIQSNTITGSRALIMHGGNGGPGSANFLFAQNLMLKGGNVSANLVSNDTIKDCVWSSMPNIGTDWSFQKNLLYNRTNLVINESRYPFLKRGGGAILDSNRYAGARGYLININKPAYSITKTGFSINDSISEMFWYNDPVQKDSGTSTLQTALNRSGPWISHSNSGLQKAGTKSTLNATGLNPQTKYYFRILFIGTAKSGFITDTSNIDSVLITPTPNLKRSNKHTSLDFHKVIYSIFGKVSFIINLQSSNFIRLQVFDLKGRQLYQNQQKLSAGRQTINLYTSFLNSESLYLAVLSDSEGVFYNQKLIMVK